MHVVAHGILFRVSCRSFFFYVVPTRKVSRRFTYNLFEDRLHAFIRYWELIGHTEEVLRKTRKKLKYFIS